MGRSVNPWRGDLSKMLPQGASPFLGLWGGGCSMLLCRLYPCGPLWGGRFKWWGIKGQITKALSIRFGTAGHREANRTHFRIHSSVPVHIHPTISLPAACTVIVPYLDDVFRFHHPWRKNMQKKIFWLYLDMNMYRLFSCHYSLNNRV